MYEVSVDTSSRGPVLEGRGPGIVHQYHEDVLDEVAQTGIADVHFTLDRVIRDPTPYYETQIRLDRQGGDRVIHDGGVIYGPWLEGVGSRNATTRFKGYFTFRRVGQHLETYKAPAIADRLLQSTLDRLRGTG